MAGVGLGNSSRLAKFKVVKLANLQITNPRSWPWWMIVVVAVATWLRVWQLDTTAIFFGDAAHDLITASQAVHQFQLPLLGIASSDPRFHQGPITIWWEMLMIYLGINNLWGISLSLALISLIAVIGLYELMSTQISHRSGQIASLILAVSPLAVAHARMTYHITPLPLMTVIWLWASTKISAQSTWRWLIWGLSWAGIFQFELATFPLLGVAGWIFWRTKSWLVVGWPRKLGWLITGLGFGLWPQIWYDLTHNWSQLGGFSWWVIRQIVTFGWGKNQQLAGPNLIDTGRTIVTYWSRIFAVDALPIGLVWLIIGSISCYWLSKKIYNRFSRPIPQLSLIEISLVSIWLLLVGMVVQGSPSEAYFPPLLILIPAVTGYGLSLFKKRWAKVIPGSIWIWAVITGVKIYQHHFFVGQDNGFSYGPSVEDQRQIITLSHRLTNGNFRFMTSDSAGKFPNYFDNLRWLAGEQGWAENIQTGWPIVIDQPGSLLNNYPAITKFTIGPREIYYFN